MAVAPLCEVCGKIPSSVKACHHCADQEWQEDLRTLALYTAEQNKMLKQKVDDIVEMACGMITGGIHVSVSEGFKAKIRNRAMQCCERDHDMDGNCDRHPERKLG